jgi:hypothetical protein
LIQKIEKLKYNLTKIHCGILPATLIFIIVVELAACAQTKALKQKKLEEASMSDTATFVVFNKGPQQPGLSPEELSTIENILKQCISDYSSEQKKSFEEIKKKPPKYKRNRYGASMGLSQYKRQYVPSINAKGEKEVWVNCFCGHWDSKWKEKIIRVEDGGSCYFNVTVNLTTGKYYEFKVNGVA